MSPEGHYFRALDWRKSSFSIANGACVEVASCQDKIAVRNSYAPDGPILVFGLDGWHMFLDLVKAGEFDPPVSG